MSGEGPVIQGLADKDARPDENKSITYTETTTKRGLDTNLLNNEVKIDEDTEAQHQLRGVLNSIADTLNRIEYLLKGISE